MKWMPIEVTRWDTVSSKNDLMLALLSGFVLTAFLQLSIILLSELRPPEKVSPELVVNWLLLPQQTVPANNKKTVRTKPAPVIAKPHKKKRIKKETRIKKVLHRKNSYSAMAKHVAEIKPAKQEVIVSHNKANIPLNKNNDALPIPAPVFKLTQAPRFLHKEPLEYPESMRALDESGVVKLAILIDRYGVARKVTIIESAGKEFDNQAKKAILASRFFPAKIKEKPVASVLKLSVKFNLI